MFEVFWSKKAEREYNRFDEITKKRFSKMISVLERSPTYSGKSIKKLKGDLEGLYRYRIGSLRIIYTIDLDKKEVYIVTVDNRGDVY